MIRRLRDPKYTIKAYYKENNHTQVFYCKEKKIRNITNEMGASLPLSNGESMIETDADIDFKPNMIVQIGDTELTVINSDANVDPRNRNARRGKPSYITTVLLQ